MEPRNVGSLRGTSLGPLDLLLDLLLTDMSNIPFSRSPKCWVARGYCAKPGMGWGRRTQ